MNGGKRVKRKMLCSTMSHLNFRVKVFTEELNVSIFLNLFSFFSNPLPNRSACYFGCPRRLFNTVIDLRQTFQNCILSMENCRSGF